MVTLSILSVTSFLRVTEIVDYKGPRPRKAACGTLKAHFPVLFHPDYDRRLRNHTGSADLRGRPWSARGLRGKAATPPVGTSTPP